MTSASKTLSASQIEAMRQEHIGRLFLRAHRAFSEKAYVYLQQDGHEGLSIIHTALLAHLDLEGTHISTLADRAGVTKQTMGQLVNDLEKKGYIRREPDPHDRRATRVMFTESGWEFLRSAYHTKQAIEAEYAAILGEDRFRLLRELLTELLDATGS